jgi:hypothetical protein
MKLFQLHEQDVSRNPFGEWLDPKVNRRINRGDSRLKQVLTGSEFTLEHVRFAIQNGECLRNPKPGESALGPTYLEQTVSNILRDLARDKEIPLDKLNDARVYYGLERLSAKKLNLNRKRL